MELLTDPRTARRARVGGYNPSPAEIAALKVITDHYRPDSQLRQNLEQKWITNLAFYRGFQYFDWDPVQRQLVYTQAPTQRWKSRLPLNHIRPFVRQAVAQLGSFTPRFKVRPATRDVEDYQAANVGEKVLSYYWDKLQMPRKKWDIAMHLKLFGNALLKVIWDPEAGDFYHDEVEVEDSETGEMQTAAELMFEGDVVSEVMSPFYAFFDDLCEAPDQARWFMDVRAVPIEWVEEHFPEKADVIPLGVEDRHVMARRRLILNTPGLGGVQGQINDTESAKKLVLKREYWQIPSRDYPRGRLIIEANGIVLRDGDNPAPRHQLPVIWIQDEIVPGTAWADTAVDDLLPVQRGFNRLANKQMEHVVLTANAKMLEHATNDLPASAWSTEVEVIKWSGIQPPGYMPPPPLGTDVESAMSNMLGTFDRVSSSFGPSRGQYQGKISGRAYLSLIEQDVQNKAPTIERLAEGLTRWGQLILEWARDQMIEQRLIKVVGRDQQFDVMEFKGSDIGDNTDVNIDVSSMMPKSKAMALELLASLSPGEKWLTAANPDDRTRVFRMLAMEDDERLIQDKRIDERNAMIENEQMFLGKIIPPAQSYEDQDIHVLVHTEAMKSDEFKKAGPVIQAIFMQHMQTHRDIVTPQVGATMPPEETMMEGPDAGAPMGGGQMPGMNQGQGPKPQAPVPFQ